MDYIYSYKQSSQQLTLTVTRAGRKQVVFSLQYPTFYEEHFTGELIEDGTLISYGVMKNLDDISGLEDFLKNAGIINQEDTVESDLGYTPASALEEIAAKSNSFDLFLKRVTNIGNYGIDINSNEFKQVLDLKDGDQTGNLKKMRNFYYGIGKDLRLERRVKKKEVIGKANVDAIELLAREALKIDPFERGGQCGCNYEDGGSVEDQRDRLMTAVDAADSAIKAFQKKYPGSMGGVSGAGRMMDEFKRLKANYSQAFSALRDFNKKNKPSKKGYNLKSSADELPALDHGNAEEDMFAKGGCACHYEPSKFLTPEHQAIEKKFGEQLFTDYEAQKREYIKRFGKIINTDNARELSDDYRGNKQELSSAVHEPASAFVKMLYADLLQEKPVMEYVLFTSGGTGSGKTTAINKLPATKYLSDNADMVYDSNMNNTPSAAKKIDQALLSGRRAVVIFVYRDPVEAFENGVIPRSTRSGRTVPIYEHVNTHIGSIVSIGELMEKYKDNPRVVFQIIDNSLGKDKSKLSTLADVKKKSYLATEELKNTLYEINEQKWKDGKISQGQYNGFAQGKVFEQGGNPQIADAGIGGIRGQANGYEPQQPGSPRQEQLAYGGSPYAGTNAMPEHLADQVAFKAVNSNTLTKGKSNDERSSIAVALTDYLIQKANYMYRHSPVFRVSLNGSSPVHGRNKLEEYMYYWAKIFLNKGLYKKYKEGGSITGEQDAILSQDVPDVDEQDMTYSD